MATLNFNGETAKKFAIRSFNRDTQFDNGEMRSYAYAGIVPDSTAVSRLQAYGLSPITRIQIRNNSDEIIYDVNNITAQLNNITESLEDETINVSINLTVSV